MDDFIVEDKHNALQIADDEHGAVFIIRQDGEFWLTNDDLSNLRHWLLMREAKNG